MAFRIDPGQPLAENLRRVARHELDGAIAHLADPGRLGLEETVHDVRKRCKRVRGLIRLARPALGRDYRRVNAEVRDAAAGLGALRDAQALLGTYDALVAATHRHGPPSAAVAHVREELARRAREAEGADAPPLLELAAARLQRVRDRVDGWSPGGGLDVLLDGLADNHALGRRAFLRCVDEPGDEVFHEWRKRVKYGWHHAQLLRPLAPAALQAQEAWLDRLGDGLGDDHDLAVLRGGILAGIGDPGDAGEVVALVDLVQGDLRDRCLRLGARVYAESPRALRARVAGYLGAWRDLGPEREVGSIAHLAGSQDDPLPAAAPAPPLVRA